MHIGHELISGLRMAVLILWSIILLWGQPAYRRCLWGSAVGNDWLQSALGAAGFAIIGFQLRSFLTNIAERGDYWTACFLFLSAIAAIIVLVNIHWTKAPEVHRRAILWTHAGIVLLCLVGGFL